MNIVLIWIQMNIFNNFNKQPTSWIDPTGWLWQLFHSRWSKAYRPRWTKIWTNSQTNPEKKLQYATMCPDNLGISEFPEYRIILGCPTELVSWCLQLLVFNRAHMLCAVLRKVEILPIDICVYLCQNIYTEKPSKYSKLIQADIWIGSIWSWHLEFDGSNALFRLTISCGCGSRNSGIFDAQVPKPYHPSCYYQQDWMV